MKSIFKYKEFKDYEITLNNWGGYSLPYEVKLEKNGEVINKIKCDTYSGAREYFKQFQRIALEGSL